MIPVYCPLCCDQPFEDQDGLFHHLRSLRNNLFCPICSERFSSFDFLIKHLSRKCNGPLSPHEAKRKCLYNQTKLPDTLLDAPADSLTSLDPGNTQDVLQDTSSDVTCGASLTASPAPTSVIPPEIRDRLPRGVTLCPLNSATPSQQSTAATKPATTPTNNSLSLVFNNDSINSSVEISVKPGKEKESTLEQSILSGILVKDTPSKSVTENETQSSPTPKQSRKSGPLSSKVKGNFSFEKSPGEVSLLNSNEEIIFEKSEALCKKDTCTKTSEKSNFNKSFTKNNNNKSPIVNGVVDGEKPSKRTNTNSKKQNKLSQVHSSNSTEKLCNRTVKTRGKKISFSKLLQSGVSDDSDHFEDDGSCNSDKKEESEELISNLKKNGNVTKEKLNCVIEVPAAKNIISEPETINLDSNDSSLNAEPNNVEENVLKDGVVDQSNTAKEEPKDVSSLDENKTEEEEEEYTCSACNIRFTSIYEHIKQYHNGQEVVVEVPEEEIKEDLKAYQETTESLVSIGESEHTDTPVTDNDGNPVVKQEKASPQHETKSDGKRKKEKTMGFSSEDGPNDLVYTKTFKKVKKDTGEHWVELMSNNRKIYQFVRDEDKFQMLIKEFKNNTSIHPELNIPVKTLFETPKINVIEITFQPNSPVFVNRFVNLKSPMPMFIVDRVTTNNPEVLGGIASYIMAGKQKLPVPEDSKLIAVMKVILASDQQLTVENLVFNDKPQNLDMVPVLEDVKTPDIPLLKNAKILKWRCNKCLATTWKFPVQKDTHYCNACPICHKTFMSPVSLKKHLVKLIQSCSHECESEGCRRKGKTRYNCSMMLCGLRFLAPKLLHKRDGTRYCRECRAAFISKVALNSHLALHITHVPCKTCHLFVQRDNVDQHAEIHTRDSSEQFPCSVCKKVFGSGQDLKHHESKLCSQLVARFPCSLCDKKFLSESSLTHHIVAHKASIRLKCRFCPKYFIQEREKCPKKAGKRKHSIISQKIWHERIHTRDRPYSCASCPKRFRSQEQELHHSAVVHTSDNSTQRTSNTPLHMCTYCDRVFRSERQLANHMKQHTDSTIE